MNAKKAKNLRRIARELTVGELALSYVITRRRVELLTTCTRGVYQRLKKQLRSRA